MRGGELSTSSKLLGDKHCMELTNVQSLLIIMTVECRRRVKIHGTEKCPPENGDTFWQFELTEEPCSGELSCPSETTTFCV